MISKLELDSLKDDDLLLIAPLITGEHLGSPATSSEAGAFDDSAREPLPWAFRSWVNDAPTPLGDFGGLTAHQSHNETSTPESLSPDLNKFGGSEAIALGPANVTPAPTTIAVGATVEISGSEDGSVIFAGSTGRLVLNDALGFTGRIFGLSGADAIDLADVQYNSSTTASFLGDASGGTLTITSGSETATISLVGDYLSSTWDLSSDGHGGVTVVDPVVNTSWQTLKVGAGGFVRGLDIAPDGTMVGRTDTNGAYLWDAATSSWTQLVTASSMPAAMVAADPAALGEGVFEIQIADSNTQIFYMIFNGYMFKSANQGATWTQQTSFDGGAQITANPNDNYGQVGQRMAIDPNNPNIVYAGSEGQGMFVTTNGGVTWTSVAAIPAGDDAGITGILFDPAASAGVVGGVTQTIFASSYGNGVYESTNAGATWSHLSGGPTDVENAAVSSTGVYYAVGDSNSSLWSYAGGKWTELMTGSQVEAIAVDPNNANELVVTYSGGNMNISYDGGATWSGANWNTHVAAADIPWEQAANAYMDIGNVMFSPTVPNELIASGGTGVWQLTNLPTSGYNWDTPITWNDMSVGIENLVANEIIAPLGGAPVLASWDRPFFDITNLNQYPTTYGPVNSSAIVAGWSVDYASSSPGFLVGIADWWGTEESGYSTNGGKTWTDFATDLPGADSSYIGGTIAASTPQNIIWAPADGFQPYYTTNGGATWNAITLPGVTSWSGFDYAYYLDARTVAADRVLSNTFYLFDAGQGLFETTNGGATWTKKYSGDITLFDNYNAELMSTPGEAGELFFTGGPQGATLGNTPAGKSFMRSTNQGAAWTAIPNVEEVLAFGFGAAAPGQSNPALYIVGWVNNVYGVWQSNNATNPSVTTPTWVNLGTEPTGALDEIKTISGDMNVYGQVYVGNSGGGYQVLVAPPSVTGVTATGAGIANNAGTVGAGTTITFTINLTANVTVAGGAPTLTLNDGGVAAYVGGSGTNALTFSYTVASGQNVSGLAITSFNLPSGAAIQDDVATAAVLTGAVTTFANITVNTGAVGGPVTVAYYLANTAALDAAGQITISDTAANVSAAFDTLNADAKVSAITLTGTPTLNLDVAQTLNDTHALNAITNTNYGIVVTDTGANVAANLAALNADSHITSILPADGSQNLVLTMAQMTNDARAISLLDPFIITVKDTASGFDALSGAQIATLKADGVTLLDATNTDVALTNARREALGADGISVIQPYSGGTTEVVTYAATGRLSTIVYQGVAGQPYTSFTVNYGSGNKPASATYGDGMTKTWNYKADGFYDVVLSNILDSAFTSLESMRESSGALTRRCARSGLGIGRSRDHSQRGDGIFRLQRFKHFGRGR